LIHHLLGRNGRGDDNVDVIASRINGVELPLPQLTMNANRCFRERSLDRIEKYSFLGHLCPSSRYASWIAGLNERRL